MLGTGPGEENSESSLEGFIPQAEKEHWTNRVSRQGKLFGILSFI